MNEISFPCIKISQPIGEFYIGSIPYAQLIEITYADRRKLAGEKDFENYLGIQRPLDEKRVSAISKYIETADACFPTAVILAIPGKCATYNEEKKTLTLKPYSNEADSEEVDSDEKIDIKAIARILDGQHRIEGLKEADITGNFDINVSLFIDMDMAGQAYLFSTVNLAQTKVNKSLVYDLFDLAKKKSPQKTCHNIAIVLDKHKDSPFYQKIKRLGVSTEGRFNETITQATFVEALIKYISEDPIADRSLYLQGKKPELINADKLKKIIFRNMFINDEDMKIADVIWNYFCAVQNRWPEAWANLGNGNMLNKTNGFKALMRFLKPVYLYLTAPGKVPTIDEFSGIFNKIKLKDSDFNTDDYKPGSSGEGALFRKLTLESGIQ